MPLPPDGSAVQRREIVPPTVAEPEKVDASTVQTCFEPRYSTPGFIALLAGCWAEPLKCHVSLLRDAHDVSVGIKVAGRPTPGFVPRFLHDLGARR
jgi:hypothetical protein